MPEAVANQLKALRTRSGLSVRKLAAELEIEPSRYAYFEDASRFKKPRLELGFARSLAAVFADRGVSPAETLQLAGLEGEAAAADFLSKSETRLIESYRILSPVEREMVLKLIETLAVGSAHQHQDEAQAA